MKKSSRALMVQGTTSDAGKSVLVAGLCRVLARKGIKVAPFKPQNMALNSAVTADGGEIGRAQAVQALACGIEPTVHMNPVLLKPNSDTGAQVILQGRALTDMEATSYHDYKKVAMDTVMDSFARLERQFETIIIEGAGSPAEINLRANDIANMGFAEKADVPVIIVADIDRGGVFAHLYGTLELLEPSEQDRVIGFVINRFRGDLSLLQSGLDWLEEKTGKPVLGVIPYLHGLDIEAEDAIDTKQTLSEKVKLRVVVPVFTRISNHTDFDVLRHHPEVSLRYVGQGERLDNADLIILPGSKSTRSDLDYLYQQGWDKDIQRHLRYGGKVLGICGGFQMLGGEIGDPSGIESQSGISHGLGLFDMQTVMHVDKTLTRVSGVMSLGASSVAVSGYEIHAGKTTANADYQPLIILSNGECDGYISTDGQIAGTYLHGVLDAPQVVSELVKWVNGESVDDFSFQAAQQKALDRLADALDECMDWRKLWPDLY